MPTKLRTGVEVQATELEIRRIQAQVVRYFKITDTARFTALVYYCGQPQNAVSPQAVKQLTELGLVEKVLPREGSRLQQVEFMPYVREVVLAMGFDGVSQPVDPIAEL